MAKNRLFKDFVKISEVKDITKPICIIMSIVLVGAAALGFWENSQDKQLDALEKIVVPLDQKVASYRTDVKKYFSGYLSSDAYRVDFKEKTGISDYLYDTLEIMDVVPEVTQEQQDAIIDEVITRITKSNEVDMMNDVAYRDLYNTLYQNTLIEVRDSILKNQKIQVEKRVVYDVDTVTSIVEQKLRQVKNQNSSSNSYNLQDIQSAYVETIVDKTLDSLELTNSDNISVKNDVLKSVTDLLKTDEWQDKMHMGKDGKDGHIGKDGKEVVAGVDYYTSADKKQITETVLSASTEVLNQMIEEGRADELNISGVKGYSLHDRSLKITDATDSGNTLAFTLTLKNGDKNDDTVLKNEVDMSDIQRVEKMTYNADTEKLSIYYEGSKKATVIPIQSFSQSFADIYLADIYDQLYDFPLTYTPDDSCKDTPNGWSETQETDENGTPITTYKCNSHNITLTLEQDEDGNWKYTCSKGCIFNVSGEHITFNTLLNEFLSTKESLKNMLEQSGATQEDNYTDADNVLDNVENIKGLLLNKYDSILTMFDTPIMTEVTNEDGSVTETFKTPFQMYDKAMQNVDGNNRYGVESVHGVDIVENTNYSNILQDLVNENDSVLKNFLMHDGYIVENDGKIEFAGNTLDEKLNNAYESQLTVYMQNMYETLLDTNNSSGIANIIIEASKWFKSYNIITEVIKNGLLVNVTDLGSKDNDEYVRIEPFTISYNAIANDSDNIYELDIDTLVVKAFRLLNPSMPNNFKVPVNITYADTNLSNHNETAGALSSIRSAIVDINGDSAKLIITTDDSIKELTSDVHLKVYIRE